MTDESPFENGAPNRDVKVASTSGVSSAAPEGRVTGKLAKFLDLMDNELAEPSAKTSAK